jgi:HK97 family phage major capsid protein
MNIAQLEREWKSKHDAAMALLDKTRLLAEAESREFTPEERAAMTAAGAEAKAAKDRHAQAVEDAALFTNIAALAPGPRPVGQGGTTAALVARGASALAPHVTRLSLGAQFTQSDAYEFIRQRQHRNGAMWRTPSAELLIPAGMMAATLTEDPASGGALVQPQYLPGIRPLPTRRLVVADLMPNSTTDSNMVSYMEELVFTNAAAAVLEGAAKPESTLTFAARTDPVRKLAHWLPVTEEMLEDVPQLQGYINARLTIGLQLEEEDQILNGDGVAPNLYGIMRRAVAPPVARADPATNADALAAQFFQIFATSYLVPDGFVLNPMDWAATLLSKSTTGEYLVGGPFTTNLLQSTLWGVPVAATPEMVLGTALVGAFQSGAQVFRHGGIRVEASNSHQDFFVKNLVAIRAEERLALAVYRPSAFGTVTGLVSGPTVP